MTGAGRGIGKGIALGLAQAGCDVAMVGRTSSDLESTAEDVRAAGKRAAAFVGNLRDPNQIARITDQVFEVFPTADILINNAGLLLFEKPWRYARSDYRAIIETNLTAPFLLTQAFARRWVSSGTEGRIVNVASVESEVAYPDQAPYAATKGGLLTMTKVMALELGPHGIRANAIGPGPIDTPISRRFREVSEAGVVFHRLGRIEEVGEAVVFLASAMSSFVTGTILYVDGGYTLS